MNQLTTKPTKLNKKQLLFMELWTEPGKPTFGNVYQSGLAAGFSPSYSRNLTNLAPKWLSEYIDKINLEDEHIKQGVQSIAIATPNSKSPDDTRLKAYEMLARFNGMLDNKQQTTINIVQPILGGMSANTNPKDSTDSLDSTYSSTNNHDNSNNSLNTPSQDSHVVDGEEVWS